MNGMRMIRWGVIAGLLTSLALQAAEVQEAEDGSLKLLHNATIYTVDQAKPNAGAMVFSRAGEIIALGKSDKLLQDYPDATRLDAGGRAVLPGLIDAHGHIMGLGLALSQVNLVGTASRQEVLKRLIQHATSLGPDAWLVGRGWDQNDWKTTDFPSRSDLDQACPTRPVWLTRIDGHASWANTAALQAAGIDPAKPPPDPPGGRLLRDASGHVDGVFIDAAQGLVARAVPAPSPEQRAQALETVLAHLAQAGLTQVHDAGTSLADWRLFQSFDEEERLSLRIYSMADGDSAMLEHLCENGPIIPEADGLLTARAVKFYLDGALGSRGAALKADYSDDAGNRGLLFHDVEPFTDLARRAMDCQLQVNTHAIGDRAVATLLEAYQAAMNARNQVDRSGRHRIEHAQVLGLEEFAQAKRLGLVASMQPTHATSDMPWADERLGDKRLKGAYAWRSFLNAGVPLAFGSDFPVESANPLHGFYAAITRQDHAGEPKGGFLPEQKLTRPEALRAFTLGGAFAGFAEDSIGSLAAGKRADFVILSADIMRIEPSEIPGVQVLATFVDGQTVFVSDQLEGF